MKYHKKKVVSRDTVWAVFRICPDLRMCSGTLRGQVLAHVVEPRRLAELAAPIQQDVEIVDLGGVR